MHTPVRPTPLGESPAFLALLEQVSRAAPLPRPLLVVGERGTGKELIAARLHYLSGRWDGPFMVVNCAALPETLLESELFGHEAGAFTGAHRRRRGRFEAADGGTLFLDEIAAASAAVQERLLRIIEYGEFERVGDSRTRQIDVRIVAAANIDLPAAAAAGRFREDLLDRLSFQVLTVPPLRAREGDIPLLSEAFARDFAIELGWPRFPGFTENAMTLLRGHAWPGNVRELKNTVERALHAHTRPDRPVARVILDPFDSPHRPAPPAGPSADSTGAPARQACDEAGSRQPATNLRRAVRRYERELLESGLARHRYNRRSAAAALGLSYDQLRALLRKHGLTGAPRR